ncbi:MAG: NAD(P)/FAD-dependent oxidoreductase, partial [Candidatus Binatia bacterium]
MSGKKPRRLVVVGNGMAAGYAIEEILARDPDAYAITVFGAEPYGNYNRILLSEVLNGSHAPERIFLNPLAWYAERGIVLHAGVKASRIDRERRVVIGRSVRPGAPAYGIDGCDESAPEIAAPYDQVILATGSRPFVPPIEGLETPGTFLFRTLEDCERIGIWAATSRRAVVIGGGLLGLEAARGLLAHALEVTVVEAAPQLMAAQLDAEAGAILRTTLEAMGIRVVVDAVTARILGEERVRGLMLKDGTELEADLVVVSAGIRPITEVAAASGLRVGRAVVCDDQLRT